MLTNTPQADPVALKPCPSPWCETSDPHVWETHRGHFYVRCRTCGQRGPGPFTANDIPPEEAQAEAIEAWNTRTIPPTAASSERPDGAIDALTNGQQQADMDGVMVKVSRQALDETLAYIATLETRLAHMTEAAEDVAERGWLIEEDFGFGITHWIKLTPGAHPHHTVRRRNDFEFGKFHIPVERTKDSNEALRFARKEDAEAFVKAAA